MSVFNKLLGIHDSVFSRPMYCTYQMKCRLERMPHVYGMLIGIILGLLLTLVGGTIGMLLGICILCMLIGFAIGFLCGYSIGYNIGEYSSIAKGLQIEQAINIYECKCLLNEIYKQNKTAQQNTQQNTQQHTHQRTQQNTQQRTQQNNNSPNTQVRKKNFRQI